MAEFDNKSFGQKLRNYRLAKGLSQENIAESINKTKTTISRYENGEIILSAKEISEIFKILGI